MYKYSVIITFYNAEKYIKRTLENVLEIADENIEIIIVDDGSTDRTLNIINSFDIPNSKVITQKNSGVSSARNRGLKCSSGEYVMFLDGDDWLDINIFKKLDKYYDKSYDVVKFGFVFTDLEKNSKFEIVCEDKKIEKNYIQDFINDMLATNKFNSASNQIIKRQLLLENSIYFTKNRKFAEDFEFNLKLIKHVSKIYISNDCLYYYYDNSSSTTRLYTSDNILKCLYDAIYIYINSLHDYEQTNTSSVQYLDVLDRVYNEIINCFKRTYYINDISVKKLNEIVGNIYTNNQYQKLQKELIENKYVPKKMFNKLFLNKKILKYNYIIVKKYKFKLFFKKLKKYKGFV